MSPKHQELKAAVATFSTREALNPGLWDEELASAKGKLSRFETVELNHCYWCGAKVSTCTCQA